MSFYFDLPQKIIQAKKLQSTKLHSPLHLQTLHFQMKVHYESTAPENAICYLKVQKVQIFPYAC